MRKRQNKNTEALDQSSKDLTFELKQKTSELAKEVEFEKLLTDLTARIINVPSDQVDREIEDAQQRVCEFLGLDLASIWQWPTDNPYSFVLTHIYRPPGFPPTPEEMNAEEYFPWMQKQIMAGKVTALSSMEDLPAEAVRDKEFWIHYGIKTALTIPLSTGGAPPFGAVTFNDVRQERTWSEKLVNRLQLIVQIFANALARKRSDQIIT